MYNIQIGESSATSMVAPSSKKEKVSCGKNAATEINKFVTKIKSLSDFSFLKRKPTRQERAERMTARGVPKPIITKFECEGGVEFKSTTTPRTEEVDGKKIFWTSDRNSEGHISNLWHHDIEVNGQKLNFIRSGSTRGNEEPTKELIAEALALKYDLDEWEPYYPVELDLSNVQLMTPVGKVGDGSIPLKQMKALQKLAGKQQPIEITHNGKTFKVKLNPPLLFNFGVNLQHFRMGRLAHSSEIDTINQESFKRLFGVKNFTELQDGEFCRMGSLIYAFIKDPNNNGKNSSVIKLAKQIVAIMQKHPDGIEANPYALPVRVMLLTNLLGFATTYGCKSGKDRTGVCAMELEALTAKLLPTDELYDPENPSEDEKALLRQIYMGGEAIAIADANIGENKLKIQELFGFKSLRERFGVKLSKDYFLNALEELNKKVVENLGNAKAPSDHNINISAQANILLEKAKKKPKELTYEDKRAIQKASTELDEILRNKKEFPKEYFDLIARVIDSSERFFPTLVDELENLDKRMVDALKALKKQDKDVTNLGNIRLQVALLLEKAKKKPKELTDEDRKAMFSASMELAKVAQNADLPEEYRDLIARVIDSSERFFPENIESTPPKEVVHQAEKSPKDQLLDELKQKLAERGKIE